MQGYADFTYYNEVFGGTSIPADCFDRHAFKVSRYLDKITFDRVGAIEENDELMDQVRYAVCEMVEQSYTAESAKVDGKTVKSVSNDGYSMTFVTEADGGSDLTSGQFFNIAMTYLPSWLFSFARDEKRCLCE
jgi:hypothetical protein